MLVATISFVVIFSALLLIPRQNYLPYTILLPEPEKKHSSKEGIENTKAMTLPGAIAYKIVDGKAQPFIKLNSLACVVLKNLRIDKKRYYLIQFTGKENPLSIAVNQWIVREKDVILLPEPLEWTDSGDKAL